MLCVVKNPGEDGGVMNLNDACFKLIKNMWEGLIGLSRLSGSAAGECV